MRDMADTLDKYASAMSSAYVARTGKPQADIMALMADGKDHWFTAAEALAEGYVSSISESLAIAASLDTQFDLSRYTRFKTKASPSAALVTTPVAATNMEINMPEINTPPAATAAEILAADKSRRAAIRAEFAPFASAAWHPALLDRKSVV